MRFDIRFWACRTAGALAGIAAGPFGIVFGFLIGFLLDQLIRTRSRIYRLRAFLRNPLSTLQDVFPVEVIVVAGIGVYLAAVNGAITVRKVAIIRNALLRWFPEVLLQPETLDRLIDDVVAAAGDIDGPGLAHILAARILRANDGANDGASAEAEQPARTFIPAAEIEHFVGDLYGNNERRMRGLCERLGLDAERIVAASREGSSRPMAAATGAEPLDTLSCSILGVSQDADVDEVKRVFRTLATRFHPDALGSLEASKREQSTRAFIRIKSAYDTLLAQLAMRCGGPAGRSDSARTTAGRSSDGHSSARGAAAADSGAPGAPETGSRARRS